MKPLVPLIASCVLVLSAGEHDLAAQEPPAKGKPQAAAKSAKPDRATLERQFAEKLSGAVLVGNFTVDGQQRDEKPLKPERYEIAKAEKVAGEEDLWEITARIKYGQLDQQVPIRLNVYWADDTPVMSLTDLTIPFVGDSFTARVLFYGDRYVGTWQHGKVGGHMFGNVERAEGDDEKVEVSGMVTLDGRPLDGAVIEFVPADGKGKPVSGKTDAAGQFKLKSPTGEARVIIRREKDNARPRSTIPARYSDEKTSALKVDVSSGENQFNFELQSN
ncbi:MAG: hypothetical protein KY476_18750 [Planctomycetes bacterium]|nr:hypothetical protein [Planctomycetota bacterium]